MPFTLLLPLLFTQSPAPAPAAVTPDFKVVYWLDGATLRHQVYDVREGQYTAAVEDWLRQQRPQYDAAGYSVRGRLATVRDVYLSREPGRTESEKLAAAIARDSLAILGGDFTRLEPPSPPVVVGLSPTEPVIASRPAIVGRSSFYMPPQTSSPLGFAPIGSAFPGTWPAPVPGGPDVVRWYLVPPPSVPIYLLAHPR